MINHLIHYRNLTGSPDPKKGAGPAAGESGRVEKKDRTLAIDKAGYVVVDTELTGLNSRKDSVVSLGAVRMNGMSIELGDSFYRVIAPETRLTGRSVIIHGITPSEAAECPAIEALLPEFLAYCGDEIIVGHFVSIDLKFINKEMNRLYGRTLRNRAVDTLKIYRWIRRKEERACAYHEGNGEDTSLSALAKKYGISISGAHNALSDAFVTAQLFQRFVPSLLKLGVCTTEDLVKIGRP